jgi:hypothetical protein
LKLAIALLGLMLLVGGVSFIAYRTGPSGPPCAVAERSSSLSPDGRTQADVYEQRCGDSVATHVALRPASAPVQARGDVFIAAGSEQVSLSWRGDREVVVESPARRVLASETSWRNVGVRLQLVR